MGLLYPFPASLEETDFVTREMNGDVVKSITVKTYGLPYIFWFYAAAFFAVVFFLWLAVKASLAKLSQLGDATDLGLVWAMQIFLASLPLCTLGFLFFEKRLHHSHGVLKIQYRIFGLPIRNQQYQVTSAPFTVDHFIDAPNMARIKGGEESRGFQNKGYFTLWAQEKSGSTVWVDRHSRKADLVALQNLLNSISEPINQGN